ncbi:MULTISPECIES: hypothetical protein [unclassified Flavobacterium]|uniref:hypothetical protein n=1 Tax=unclassified Flavobacterium TaxID=196869 RepID=UPI001F143EE7|nr:MULTISPECIES: hypothetical protein [unclassified Flavobacterium]UMY64554.1 hypothetical protein MKO97_08520 [Flavobacterium sp. HJ-32-4]
MEKLSPLCPLALLLLVLSCQRNRNDFQGTDTERRFDAALWQTKADDAYPYRDEILNDLFASDTLKRLSKEELLEQLGPADRSDGSYLFYEIERDKAGAVTLHTKTLVIEFEGDRVKTVRLHE